MDSDPRVRRRYRVAFVATAMLLVGIVVTCTLLLASVLDEILGLTTGKVLPLVRPAGAAIAPAHSRLHLAVIGIDEVHLIATLRLSGHRSCGAGCTWRDRLLFVSAALDDTDAEALPPSASITLPESTGPVTETFQLPLGGVPIRYPFDAYRMIVAIALQRIHLDGRIESLEPDADGAAPRAHDPGAAASSAHVGARRGGLRGAADVQHSHRVRRRVRPVLRAAALPPVLAVLLVLSIAAAAAYSVFLRPLMDLVVSFGALVLGVWGVRTIIVPVNLHFQTAVDLALSIVILFLLGGISVKALILAHDRGGLRVLTRSGRPPRVGAEP